LRASAKAGPVVVTIRIVTPIFRVSSTEGKNMRSRIVRRIAAAAIPTVLVGVAMVAASGTANASVGWEYSQACMNHGAITYRGVTDIPAETIQYGSTGDCVKYAQAVLFD
jgi:hypothetical protein